MERASATEKPLYPIGSVDNALKLLLLFRERDAIRVAEASQELGVVRSTAHRLLAMLQYHDLVRQDPDTKAYRAGPALWDIGLSVVRNTDLPTQLRPLLEELVHETGETAHLMMLQGTTVRCIDAVESPRALRTASRVGASWPAHATAPGRVLLAELPEERVRALYQAAELDADGSSSIRSFDALERELRKVRNNGYALAVGEADAEISEVAVVQRNGIGVVRCAIAVSAPGSRLKRDRVSSLVEQMRVRTDRIAKALT